MFDNNGPIKTNLPLREPGYREFHPTIRDARTQARKWAICLIFLFYVAPWVMLVMAPGTVAGIRTMGDKNIFPSIACFFPSFASSPLVWGALPFFGLRTKMKRPTSESKKQHPNEDHRSMARGFFCSFRHIQNVSVDRHFLKLQLQPSLGVPISWHFAALRCIRPEGTHFFPRIGIIFTHSLCCFTLTFRDVFCFHFIPLQLAGMTGVVVQNTTTIGMICLCVLFLFQSVLSLCFFLHASV